MDMSDLSKSINTSNTSRHSMDAIIDFLSGCIGGTASVYVGQPLDTVKVKMQTFPHLYTNSVRCFLQTFKDDGISRGLYAGTVPSLLAQVLENAVLFFAYGICQKGVMLLSKKNDVTELNAVENGLSGSCAGFFAALVLCPTELIKCKLQAMREVADQRKTTPTLRHGPWSLTREILRAEGLMGMFTGMTSTLIREMVGYSFFFGGYEISRTFMTSPGQSKENLGALKTIVCGGMGGVAFWTATFPADVVKSRIQVSGNKMSKPFLSMVLHIARSEGIPALYTGLAPCLVRTFPATGALFLAYETGKRWMKRATYGE
ncbi:hypothetical protein LSH36_922g02023 [Paralvinella palmiformis]|uniref:Mitochondrial ornithine transporter 1 n=1 Tax=Paralvinella palmiformis TaxID=53620 RepID=A0AAD9IXI2_9ANNE|nr:hypothetical protein LSH36_922g02023 [Paralvinella palmiformis]